MKWLLVVFFITVACSNSQATFKPALTPYAFTPYSIYPTPTPRPTVRPATTGLGYSLTEVGKVASEMGFLILRKDDRVRFEGGPVAAELFPPYDNVSKVWIDFDSIVADAHDVVDATALILLFTNFENGDMTWFFQDLAEGKRQTERTFGDIKMHVQMMEQGIIRITFTKGGINEAGNRSVRVAR